MEKPAGRDGVGELEAAAVGLIRRARRSCEQVGDMGYRFVGVADWLEVQRQPAVMLADRPHIGL